jgi:uncharacterized delta-60 repeat protein
MSYKLTTGILQQELNAESDAAFINLGGSFDATDPDLVFALRILTVNTDGSVDTTFNLGTGFGGTVSTIAVQDDGKILVGGAFTSYQGTARNRFVRLNTDGSVDTTFDLGVGFGGNVNTIAVQADGKILVGGAFTAYQGTTRNRFVRLDTDGSYDTTFDLGIGFDNTVQSITVQADGKILVGGAFTSYQGTVRNRFVRLNTDGSYDTTFNLGAGFGGTVNAIAVQDDGKILVGGLFTSYQGTVRNRFVRLNTDGSYDTTFNLGAGFGGTVSTIAVQADGKILVGGLFTSYQGTTRNRFVRLNTNGSYDTTFNLGTGFGNTVNAVTVQADGKILVGGLFTTYQGTTRNRFVRLNTNGSVDTTFNLGAGFGGTVSTIAVQADGKILVGGGFTTYQGAARNRFVRLNTNGSDDTTFNLGTGFNDIVNAVTVQADGKILVGGLFTTYQGTTRNRFVRLDTDGSYDTTFNLGTGFGGTVNAIAVQDDGKILVGGGFTTYQGTTRNRLVRLNTNGSYDTTFNLGTGFGGTVQAIAVQDDGKILVGGLFTTYQGTTRNRFVRLNTDGSYDTTFDLGIGFNNVVVAIEVQADGKILVGGAFSTYQGTARNCFARLNTDGSYDTTFDLGIGFNSTVNAITVQSGGKILVGGGFVTYQGTTRNRFVRLNTDGSYDTTFNLGTGFNSTAQAIAVQSGGKILVGGAFSTYQGITRNFFARLNADGSIDDQFIFSTNNSVNAIQI